MTNYLRLQMNENQVNDIQDSIEKLISLVKQSTEKTLKEVNNNRNAILRLDEKVSRLLETTETGEIEFHTLKTQHDLDILEEGLVQNANMYLKFLTTTSKALSQLMSPELTANFKLDDLKSTIFYKKLFVPICFQRKLNPDLEILMLSRRAKNLISKRKSNKTKAQKRGAQENM